MTSMQPPQDSAQGSSQESPQESWQARAEAIINDCIAAGATITYAALAARAGVPGPQSIHKLTTWLEDMMERDAAAGAPIRAQFVVSKTDGKPARGYFEKLHALGLGDGDGRR